MKPTSNPRFLAWFGESHVVDAAGQPLVVYHGSLNTDIEAFRPGIDGASWFAADPIVAAIFAQSGVHSTIYPVYLSLSNPLDTRTPEGLATLQRLVDFDADSTIAADLAPAGFDGMISEEFPGKTTYLAFQPWQIKSAIGNSGAFDPLNHCITS